MVALDTNILVIADDTSNANHHKAKTYLEKALTGSLQTCLTHQILAEYFSVITSPQRSEHPLSVDEATARVLYLNKTRRIKKVYPKRSTLKRCIQFCAEHGIRGSQVFDAIYATTLIDNRISKLATENTKDFAPFKNLGLQVMNPFHSGAESR